MRTPHNLKLPRTGSWHIARIPATTANLGPGYDTMALALSPSFYFAYRQRHSDAVTAVTGVDKHLVPRDPREHLFFHAAEFCARELHFARPRMELASASEAPLCAGLGSSAAVRLAGVLAAAQLAGITLRRDDAFSLLVKLEGHPDNAAAAVYGGLVVSTTVGGVRALRLPFIPAVGFQLLIPSYRKASTEALRRALPLNVSRADAVYNLQCQAMLLAGFLSGNMDAITIGCQDHLHQPYRASLMPGVGEVLGLDANSGFIGAVISGAGPTVLLMHEPSRPDACLRALSVFRQRDAGAKLMAVVIVDGYGCEYGRLEEFKPLMESFGSADGGRQCAQGVSAC